MCLFFRCRSLLLRVEGGEVEKRFSWRGFTLDFLKKINPSSKTKMHLDYARIRDGSDTGLANGQAFER